MLNASLASLYALALRLLGMPLLASGAYEKLLEDKVMLITVVTTVGILVVFFALLILIVIFSLFGLGSKLGKKAEKKAAPAPAAAPAPVAAPVAAPAVESGISGEIIAVIAAAVASMDGGQGYAVRSVRRAQPQGRPAWSTAAILENTRPF